MLWVLCTHSAPNRLLKSPPSQFVHIYNFYSCIRNHVIVTFQRTCISPSSDRESYAAYIRINSSIVLEECTPLSKYMCVRAVNSVNDGYIIQIIMAALVFYNCCFITFNFSYKLLSCAAILFFFVIILCYMFRVLFIVVVVVVVKNCSIMANYSPLARRILSLASQRI